MYVPELEVIRAAREVLSGCTEGEIRAVDGRWRISGFRRHATAVAVRLVAIAHLAIHHAMVVLGARP
jgi:hypothetical protein